MKDDMRMGAGGMQEDVALLGLPQEDEARVVQTAPVKEPQTPREWIKQNLFSSWANGLQTVIGGGLALFLLYKVLKFVFVTGDWGIFRFSLRSYTTGGFPFDELWRVWACVYVIAFLAGASRGAFVRGAPWHRRRMVSAAVIGGLGLFVYLFAVRTLKVWLLTAAALALVAVGVVVGRGLTRVGHRRRLRGFIIAWLATFPLVIILLRGFGGVPPRLWEGLLLNIIVAVVGIVASFPLGLLLAVGRRSTFPAVRLFCVGFIEIFRGAPLVMWLFAGQYVLELVFPPGVDFPNIIKAMIVLVLFSSAYVAEIVRGGLQGVAAGQYEAARALGLKVTRMMTLVVLPQALRNTIPAMVSHFISLFKDTSLLAAVGFSEMLDAARRAPQHPSFTGDSMEALLPAALIFFVFTYSMARWSQRLERRLGVGER